jgi:hypothetical protein
MSDFVHQHQQERTITKTISAPHTLICLLLLAVVYTLQADLKRRRSQFQEDVLLAVVNAQRFHQYLRRQISFSKAVRHPKMEMYNIKAIESIPPGILPWWRLLYWL